MRPAMTILAMASMLCSWWSGAAWALTSGPVCRRECAPRVEEQCGGRSGRELRRCRRPLVRACKATSPAVACLTTADLTRNLGDRRINPTADSALLLCRDGRFVLAVDGTAPAPPTSGTWRVALADGRLAIALDVDDETIQQLDTEPDGAGGFVVDGAPTPAPDATVACTPVGVVDPEPALDPRDPERVSAVARALTDREVSRTRRDANGGPETQSLTLCSSGALRAVTIPITLEPVFDQGTWSIDETGTTIALSLDEGTLPASFEVTVLDDGRILLDGEAADVRDARARCTDIDLQTRLTALLAGRAYVFQTFFGSLRLETTLALCDADSFARKGPVVVIDPDRGTWSVEVSNGVAELRTVDAPSGEEQRLPLELSDDGTALVNGAAPASSPDLVGRVCR